MNKEKKEVEFILNFLRTDGTVFLTNIQQIEDYINQLEQENNKQNKIIDEITGYMSSIMDCPLEVENIDLECENKCGKISEQDCWKQYFEKKVEERLNGRIS